MRTPLSSQVAKVQLKLRDDGGLRAFIVADTHGRPHPKVRERIAALSPDVILHAGDIGAPEVLGQLRELAPLVAVRGNIDGAMSGVPDVVSLDVQAGAATVLKLLLLHIAVYGPKLRAEVARLAADEQASLVVCGHSHVPFVGRDKGRVLFNPGSVGPRRMHLPIVFGVLEIAGGKLSLRHVDCESGETWLPA